MDDYDLEDQLYQEFSDENRSIDSDLEEQAKSYLYHSVSTVAKPLENKFKTYSETKNSINHDIKPNNGIQNGETIKNSSDLSEKLENEGQDAESDTGSISDSDNASVEYESDIEGEEDPPTLELTNEAPETLAMDSELDAMLMDSHIENDRYFGNDKRCRNCHQVGHIARDCSTRYCFICQSTEHMVSDCPMFKVHGREMFNHIPSGMRSEILNRCSVCNTAGHSLKSCTKLWKEYIYNPSNKVISKPGPVYCYNCSEVGHEGNRCTNSNDNERNRNSRGQYDGPRNSYRNNSSRDNRYDDRYDNRRDYNRSQNNDRHYSNSNNYRGNNIDNRNNNGYADRSLTSRARANQYGSQYNAHRDNLSMNNYRQNRNNNYHSGNYDNSNRNYSRNSGNRNYRY